MEVKLYFRMLKGSWWIIALTGLSAVAAALVMAFFTTPIYRVATRFVISPSQNFPGRENDLVDSLDTLDKRSIITTYAEVLGSDRLQKETITSLNLQKVDLNNYRFDAVVLPDSNIVEFSVQGPDPEIAALLANTIGQRAVEFTASLYQVYDMTILDSATPTKVPVSPLPLRDASVALVVGLALGTALALIRELLRAPIVHFMQERKLDAVSLALNRDAFEENLKDVAFASVQDLSLCMVHLDGLTDYINILPQPTLESILRNVTQVMKNQLRGNDLVGRWDSVVFAVLLSDTPGRAALNTMERVRSALSAPLHVDIVGEDISLSPKIGIAEYHIGDDAESLLTNTNWALDAAKKNSGIYLMRTTESI